MRTIKDIINESKHYTDEELTQKCEHAWLQAWMQDYVDPYETSPSEIENLAPEILEWSFDNVEEDLSDSDYKKCVKILKTFLK
jgi:hypothetical protein